MAIVLLVPFLALAPLHLFMPATVKAHGVVGPVQVGISFNPHRAESMGLNYRTAFTRLEALHFRVIRLSAYWDQIDQEGFGQLRRDDGVVPLARRQDDLDAVIMTMEPGALMTGRQAANDVRGRERETLGDGVHGCRPHAARFLRRASSQ